MHRSTAASAAALLFAALPAAHAAAAGADNNVEWNGLSHEAHHDRAPRVPMNREAFTVRFQSFANDLTEVRAIVSAAGGATPLSATGTVVGTRGDNDLWEIAIPASAADRIEYVIEARDGSSTAYLGASGTSGSNNVAPFVIDFDTLEHAPYGATPVPGGTVFRVWAPNPSSARVRGDFNNWGTADVMDRLGDDFITFIPGAAAGQKYKYFFNSGNWRTDARAVFMDGSDNYNAVITDLNAYQWTNDTFSPAPANEWVVYQLHVGSFAGLNDPYGFAPNPSGYRHVTRNVSHLAALGVNAVMLNPVNEFPGSISGGYNPLTAFGIESSLGTLAEFKEMVDALHSNGIAVILDVVWNHFDGNGNELWFYDGNQIYFDSPAQGTPWGDQANLDDPNVQDYFRDAAVFLLEDLRLDGFRVDAAFTMTDSGATRHWGGGQDLLREINDFIDQRHNDAFNIAEEYTNGTFMVNPTPSGMGFDAEYHEAFKNAVRDEIYAGRFGNANVSRLAASLDGTGGAQGLAAFNYFELHDDAWPLNGHERAVRDFDTTFPHDDDFATDRQKLGNGITMFAQGMPAILQGTEWLEDNGWESKIDWNHLYDYGGVLQFYKDIVQLRTARPALFADSFIRVFHVNDNADIVAWERYAEGDGSYVVVANLSDNEYGSYTLGMPRGGQWDELINSHDARYDRVGPSNAAGLTANGPARDGYGQSANVAIPARGLVVLGQIDVPCPGDLTGDGDLDIFDLLAFLDLLEAQDPAADVSLPNGQFDIFDVLTYLGNFDEGC